MPRYYCDYCDAYLTHDSPSVRKQHNAGYKHKANVRNYYMQFEEQTTQSLMETKLKAFDGGAAAAYQRQVSQVLQQQMQNVSGGGGGYGPPGGGFQPPGGGYGPPRPMGFMPGPPRPMGQY
mmetsp:Transcript_29970/g.74332  ORF Transcript_29970/g.74332 Transcript_29970/m.74332 type:complete len:121 (-) Transcript_29970:535-897(-)